ncbi:MAG TPA: DUF2721 domain-containing protein [Verrucomicrobiae bacterium]|nr:DUF2721 domain-containing protein [Verrucomicrobiae bacterium]
MPSTHLTELIPELQTAIGPVILISGVGLLLLSLTNRFGRAADRARQLLREMHTAEEADRRRLAGQVENLYQRARLIQQAIICGVISVFFAAILIIALFVAAFLKVDLVLTIILLFICCLASLIISLVAFIIEIRLSLRALRLELGREIPGTR